MKVLVLNGPNLNLLGLREPEKYGSKTLSDVESSLEQQAKTLNLDIECFQSNAEAELIEQIHLAKENGFSFIIFNPAAFTHTSVALRDALLGVEIPFIEVHISNVYQREAFRQKSYFSDIATGCIIGLGTQGYELALTAAASHLNQ